MKNWDTIIYNPFNPDTDTLPDDNWLILLTMLGEYEYLLCGIWNNDDESLYVYDGTDSGHLQFRGDDLYDLNIYGYAILDDFPTKKDLQDAK